MGSGWWDGYGYMLIGREGEGLCRGTKVKWTVGWESVDCWGGNKWLVGIDSLQ